MKMFKLILALSCVVIFCECNMLRRDAACAQLGECFQRFGLLQFNYREGVYEQFCQAEATFKNCSEDLRPRCNDEFVTEKVESVLLAGEFICSNEGSQVIHAAAQSDCITNATKKSEMATAIRNCETSAVTNAFLAGVLSEEGSVCPFWEQGLTCVTTYINENCGVIYGTFLREFFQRTIWRSLGCDLVARHVRQFVDAV